MRRRCALSPLLQSLKLHNNNNSKTLLPLISPVQARYIPLSSTPPPPPIFVFRSYAQGRVNLILGDSPGGAPPRFETIEPLEQSTRDKYKTKKRLKEQRKRDRKKRREASRADPRRVKPPKGMKKKNQRFPNPEARIKYKIEKAKIKEAMLVEKLKKYEVPKVQGPMLKPEELTGEERFYMKKMAQKRSNYVPIGRRGVFGGVVLNMHLHWKKHETVKVICKPCKPGQIHEYASEIARLSGGTPIQIIGDDTIIFYRGKNYIQPEVMSPIDTLSKKKALEKSKYEQSLESVRRFIAIAEKELELYYRHNALYGDPNTRNSDQVYGDGGEDAIKLEKIMPFKKEQSVSLNDLSNEAVDFGDESLEVEVDSNNEELQPDVALNDEEDMLSDFSDVTNLSDEDASTDLSDSDDESLELDMSSK